MPIHRAASGFWESEDLAKVPSLGIESAKLDDCVRYFHEARFKSIFGSPCFGFEERNLNFLTRIPSATILWFWDVQLDDVDGLYELRDLESVGILPKHPGIDYSRFPKLAKATITWNKRDTNIAKSSITTFYLWHFNPRSKSFAEVQIPKGAREVHLTWFNQASLDEFPILPDLVNLELHRNRNLHDLSLLPRIAPNLKRLIITTCPKLKDFSGIVDHPALDLAIVSGKRVRDR